MPAKKRFCLNGHDTEVVGRAKQRGCMACRREKFKKYYQKYRVRVRSTQRRYYMNNRESLSARHSAQQAANYADPVRAERVRQQKRKSNLKYRGVNFWIEAAKESK